MTTESQMTPGEKALRDAACDYHRSGTPGKISIYPTKPLSNQRDLSLAYSPGVAYPCLEIEADPSKAAEYTARGNLVGVVTNGTAVLGLGDIGPLAGKPVMEGKGCLFKKFADIDVFDIELAERDPDKLVDIIAALEPTLGGVNLEDIKAPECFYIEKQLTERMSIPVFHDDQHGTAIISSAALLNGLELVGKDIRTVKLAVSGAGAAALACLGLMQDLGIQPGNIFVCDSKGLIYAGRPGGFDESKARYAQPDTGLRTLADVVAGADVFLGCSTANVLKPEMVKTMADRPIILALANPAPEILPEAAKAARPDCIIATGRSDYPNQVNNVLCFPYIFRGALDCGATRITDAMKLACVREIAALAKMEISDEVAEAYIGQELRFGPDYIIPKPFDSRLILRIAPAVAQAAEASGVAARPIADLQAYRERLSTLVTHTGLFMRPMFHAAKAASALAKRVIYAEGEDPRVLRAAQMALDEGLASPLLIGSPDAIQRRIEELGLHIRIGQDVGVVDPQDNPHHGSYSEKYHEIMGREGVSAEAARAIVQRNHSVIAALAVHLGDADAMICGLHGSFDKHLQIVRDVIGLDKDAGIFAALSAVLLEKHTLFITDTYVNEDPSAQELADIARMAALKVQRFGITPRVAFLSHSNFGSSKRASALKMRRAHELFREMAPHISSEGELQGDSALDGELRNSRLPGNCLEGNANLLVCPNLDAANIMFNVLKVTGGKGLTIGPTLLGASASAHILTPSASMRRILNQTAIAVASAEARRATVAQK
ncbi:MAG: NADP-dependent malic enzyme [Brachymonas sp.]|jgi:malate dehydrogenase (oxaloacetate-decarboxylating)(NADP+)|nr:NADP-dependent malic enzyme [Brachymonas sp.]